MRLAYCSFLHWDKAINQSINQSRSDAFCVDRVVAFCTLGVVPWHYDDDDPMMHPYTRADRRRRRYASIRPSVRNGPLQHLGLAGGANDGRPYTTDGTAVILSFGTLLLLLLWTSHPPTPSSQAAAPWPLVSDSPHPKKSVVLYCLKSQNALVRRCWVLLCSWRP